MSFVLDASITAVWALSDEKNLRADLAYDRLHSDTALVSTLWWFELRNVLIVNERRKRLKPSETSAFLNVLQRLPITADSTPDEHNLLSLARTHRLTVYDAAYLELAQRSGAPLATLDTDLIRAAQAEGVPLIEAAR